MGDKQYIITNGEGSYYNDWTNIGPMFTKHKNLAKIFVTKIDAGQEMRGHYAFTLYDVVELKSTKK